MRNTVCNLSEITGKTLMTEMELESLWRMLMQLRPSRNLLGKWKGTTLPHFPLNWGFTMKSTRTLKLIDRILTPPISHFYNGHFILDFFTLEKYVVSEPCPSHNSPSHIDLVSLSHWGTLLESSIGGPQFLGNIPLIADKIWWVTLNGNEIPKD